LRRADRSRPRIALGHLQTSGLPWQSGVVSPNPDGIRVVPPVKPLRAPRSSRPADRTRGSIFLCLGHQLVQCPPTSWFVQTTIPACPPPQRKAGREFFAASGQTTGRVPIRVKSLSLFEHQTNAPPLSWPGLLTTPYRALAGAMTASSSSGNA